MSTHTNVYTNTYIVYIQMYVRDIYIYYIACHQYYLYYIYLLIYIKLYHGIKK